jgi:DNA-binding NarL/FixJ family response regulator
VISSKTVSTHRENLQRKLGIHGVVGLALYALREGITSLEYVGASPDGRTR